MLLIEIALASIPAMPRAATATGRALPGIPNSAHNSKDGGLRRRLASPSGAIPANGRLIVGYVFAICSERLLCREVRVNLAYRWFCGLSLEDKIPDHSAFSRARNERFRESDIFRAMSRASS